MGTVIGVRSELPKTASVGSRGATRARVGKSSQRCGARRTSDDYERGRRILAEGMGAKEIASLDADACVRRIERTQIASEHRPLRMRKRQDGRNADERDVRRAQLTL